MEKDNSFSILWPGRPVVINDKEFLVYPLGVSQVKRFSSRFSPLISVIKQIPLDQLKGEAALKTLSTTLAPFILDHMLDIVFDCITYKGEKLKDKEIEGIPHYILPLFLEAWISESFIGEEKVRPWIEVIERLVKEVTKKEISIWGTLSKSLSPPAIA